MKGRFRILKTGIRLHGQAAGDKSFLTCCALHNWLLRVNGLDARWEEGVPSIWEGALGMRDLCDVELHLPDAISRLLSPSEMRNFDMSGMGVGSPCDDNQTRTKRNRTAMDQQKSVAETRVQHRGTTSTPPNKVVKDLSLQYFRSKLIKNFAIAFKRNEIMWTHRNGINQQHN